MVESLDSYFPPLSNVASAIDERCQEVVRLQEEIRILKRFRRNSRAPVSRLPNEILCEIFLASICHSESELSCYRSHHTYRMEILVTLLQVCRHWRIQALALPMLWSGVSVNKWEPFELFVERSSPCPLDVTWDSFRGGVEEEDFVKAVTRNCYRIRSLSIRLSREDITQLLHTLGASGARFSMLETLRLDSYEGGDSHDYDGIVHQFPDNLLPELRELHCHNPSFSFLRSIKDCVPKLSFLRLCHLEHLRENEDLSENEYCPCTVRTVAGLVGSFSSLRTLELIWTMHVTENDIDSCRAPISYLSRLETLSLVPYNQLSAIALVTFLGYCQVAPTTSVTLRGEEPYFRPRGVRLSLKSIMSQPAKLASVIRRNQRFRSQLPQQPFLTYEHTLEQIRIWAVDTTLEDLVRHDPETTPLWTIQLEDMDEDDGEFGFQAEINAELINELPLSQLRVLRISGTSDKHFSEYEWDKLPQLRELRISDHRAFVCLVEALEGSLRGDIECDKEEDEDGDAEDEDAEDEDTDDEDTDDEDTDDEDAEDEDEDTEDEEDIKLLPNLKVLILDDISFRRHSSARKRRNTPSLAARLEVVLRERRRQGMPLTELRIQRPVFLDGFDLNQRLEGLVGTLLVTDHGYREWYGESHWCDTCDENSEEEEEGGNMSLVPRGTPIVYEYNSQRAANVLRWIAPRKRNRTRM